MSQPEKRSPATSHESIRQVIDRAKAMGTLSGFALEAWMMLAYEAGQRSSAASETAGKITTGGNQQDADSSRPIERKVGASGCAEGEHPSSRLSAAGSDTAGSAAHPPSAVSAVAETHHEQQVRLHWMYLVYKYAEEGFRTDTSKEAAAIHNDAVNLAQGVKRYAATSLPSSASVKVPDGLHPKTADLVVRFATALAEKLRKAEEKYGYDDGWSGSAWMDECRQRLMEHIEKGDPRDVAAYCAFLWHHGEPTYTGKPSVAPTFEQIRDAIVGRMGGHTIDARYSEAFGLFMRLLHRVRREECALPVSAIETTDYKTLYHELLYQVAQKHPGETRHQTALRYIRNAESGGTGSGVAATDRGTA